MAGQLVAGGQVGQTAHFARTFGGVAHHAGQPRGTAIDGGKAGAGHGQCDGAQRRGDLHIDQERIGARIARAQQRLHLVTAFGNDALEEAGGVGGVQVQGQDVGGAVPADGAGRDVPVEGGAGGGLGGKAQTQLVIQLGKLDDLLSLLQCGVQHDHYPESGFSGLFTGQYVRRGLKKAQTSRAWRDGTKLAL